MLTFSKPTTNTIVCGLNWETMMTKNADKFSLDPIYKIGNVEKMIRLRFLLQSSLVVLAWLLFLYDDLFTTKDDIINFMIIIINKWKKKMNEQT